MGYSEPAFHPYPVPCMRVALLLSSDALSEAHRWKLVSSLYDQVRSLIEGSVVLVATFVVCALHTQWWGFWALAGVTLIVTCLRLLHWHLFVKSRSGDWHTRSPEAWARDYTIGICAMASLWAAAADTVGFRFNDLPLLMFVILIQIGWLAGAGVRNAACPAAILGQILITVLPSMMTFVFGTSGVARLLCPAYLIFTSILLKVARFHGAQMLSLMESEQRLAAANEQLLKLSGTDGLTGIPNRRAFDERFAADWASAVRLAMDISVVILDVDYFKKYNDHHGHLAGDECLRAIAGHVAGAVLRASDLPARYGGEEFVVLLPNTGDQGAAEVAERLRGAIFESNLAHGASPLGRVTISVGVASIAPGLKDLPATLMNLADEALYKAKQRGRNRVCVAPPASRGLHRVKEGLLF